MDVNLPDGNGLAKMLELRDLCCLAEIIIITAYGEKNGAELALNSGAWDYIQKTDSISEIKLSLSRAVQYVETNRPGISSRPKIDLGNIMGKSSKLRLCFGKLAKVPEAIANLLLTGETGTGKELFARPSQKQPAERRGPFITVDCASLTPTGGESIVRSWNGAFTGPTEDGMD